MVGLKFIQNYHCIYEQGLFSCFGPLAEDREMCENDIEPK
jgi:hypothetical protein